MAKEVLQICLMILLPETESIEGPMGSWTLQKTAEF